MAKQEPNFYFSQNSGLNQKGGLEYHLLFDNLTGRQDVETIVVGGRPFIKDQRPIVPRWAKKIPTMQGAPRPSIHGQKIIRGSIVKQTINNREWYVVTNGDDDPNDYILVKTGFDMVEDKQGNRSQANHRRQIQDELGRLFPHGVIAYDCDAMKLVSAEDGDTETSDGLLNDPNFSVPKTTPERLGRSKETGKYIPSIDCCETEISQWLVKPRDALLKGTPWGEVRIIRRGPNGLPTERTTEDSFLKKVFYRGLAADKQAKRAEIKEAKKILKPDGQPVSKNESVVDSNYRGGVSFGGKVVTSDDQK